jgi:hypothetical protein
MLGMIREATHPHSSRPISPHPWANAATQPACASSRPRSRTRKVTMKLFRQTWVAPNAPAAIASRASAGDLPGFFAHLMT